MAKSEKVAVENALPSSEKVEEATKQRIAILLNHFRHSEDSCPHIFVQHISCWTKGQIIRDEEEIKLLISLNAPIELWYIDNVNRQPKG